MNKRVLSTLIAVIVLSVFAATTASAASPFRKIRGGTVHVPSSVIFPARVGVFQFSRPQVYGSGGRDAGAEYHFGRNIRCNVYIYPLGTYGKDFNAELRVQQNAINQMNKSVNLVSAGRFQLNQGGRSITGTRAQYELTRVLYQKKAQRCGSQLYLFRDGPWLVQYRFSYPIEQSAAASRQIADFLRLWQWRAQGNLVELNQRRADGRNS
ncbi:MAG TPA: hypothetical protein VM940_15835 [Chthoniobacterales bacterium]|jgi:hypothetical protein|nr:hypothetical protein [Chthoniobacterales bacterium]